MASGDNVCFSSLLTAWRRPCALEFMSDSRAASSALRESKLPVNCGQRRKQLKLMQIMMMGERTDARPAVTSSMAIFRAGQSTSEPCCVCSPEDGSDMGGKKQGGVGRSKRESF